MVKFHYNFIIFLLMICNSGVVSQTTPEIICPKDLDGVVKLNISTFTSLSKDKFNYDLLAVFVKNGMEEDESTAIQGRYTIDGNYLVFKPYFPFDRGLTYIIRTQNTNTETKYLYQSFQVGKKHPIDKAEVLSIYPSADQLPENLLRFYIYFNSPMKKGQALKHINLIDAEGNIDSHAFMEFKQELWSTDGKRLTILFDPGRIKRGVSTNRLRGPALLKGKKYKLKISGVWQDIYGQSLSVNTTKEFEIGSAYRQHIKATKWVISKPKVNSDNSLFINFDRIIDHALIQSMIELKDAENNLVAGQWEILENEQVIKFVPSKKWKKGNYQIIIDSRLEDVAGNNLQNLLDHNTTDKYNNSEVCQIIDFIL